jgi:hypothetical protein
VTRLAIEKRFAEFTPSHFFLTARGALIDAISSQHFPIENPCSIT